MADRNPLDDLFSDDPQEQQIITVVKDALAKYEVPADKLDYPALRKRIEGDGAMYAQSMLEPRSVSSDLLRDTYLGSTIEGLIVEQGTYTVGVPVGLPVNIAVINFATAPLYFDANGWPLASWSSFYKLGSIVSGMTGTAAYSNGVAQNVQVNWICIRPKR